MTSSFEELTEIDKVIENLTAERNARVEKEAMIQMQISALRLEIAQLNDDKFQIKQKIAGATKQRESLVRKAELEKEAQRVQQSIEEKRALVADILANAPWKDDAFDWQIEGALMLPERALLGDKRGLGKTLSSLIWRRIQKAKKTLVCLRREVASDFIKEIGIREPGLFVYSLLGATSEQRKIAAMLLSNAEEFVVVTNIESWRRNVDETTEDILRIPYDAVILDEAHHIKNSKTGTAQGFFKLVDRIPKVLEMTGTPIKNRPQEMYSLLHALYPDQFPKETKFLYDYCVMVGQNKWTFSPAGLKSLVAKISHFYVARSPEDIGRKLPPPRIIEYKLDFDGHPLQKQAYEDMTERSLAILDSGKVVPIVSQLAVMTRQAQIVSWPADIRFEVKDEFGEVVEVVKFDIHESVKMDWAEELIRELVEEGERVVLFSRFKPALLELQRRLSDIPVALITGDTKLSRSEVFDDFDLKTAPENPRFKVLLATYQTVGESANLNAATHMVLYDRFWNPGNEDQAIGRVDRINSVTQATIHVPAVENSIDIYMGDLIEGKRNIVTEFKDASAMQMSLIEHLKETK
jgi:SNF2 family DNA or RNA helicase